MILWVILFLLIVAISFVLAMQSMRDYHEIPQKSKVEYGLFLIRKTDGFNVEVLDSLLRTVTAESLIISIERLFKGSETALTIFGPKGILLKFSDSLNLLELEDYTLGLESQHFSAWELGAKDTKKFNASSLDNVLNNLPPLDTEDQFFWQIILGKDQAQIRAALHSKDDQKLKALVSVFHNLKLGELIKIPRPFSKEQMMTFYQLRSLSKDSQSPVLTSKELIRLLKIA